MASSPKYKLYDENGEYVGSVKTLWQASVIVSRVSDMVHEVRVGHAKKDVIYSHGLFAAWCHGKPEVLERNTPGYFSPDDVAECMCQMYEVA
jgi:hypothetical protein